jgi:hypothetical protein
VLRLLRGAQTIDDLVQAVARTRGRNITLLDSETDPDGFSGLWIATATADYIAYDARASAASRDAIICHELAHMLLGHDAEDNSAQIAELFAPHLSPALVRRFLSRHGYENRIEAEAESLGTLMAAELARRAERLAVRHDDVSQRLR